LKVFVPLASTRSPKPASSEIPNVMPLAPNLAVIDHTLRQRDAR